MEKPAIKNTYLYILILMRMKEIISKPDYEMGLCKALDMVVDNSEELEKLGFRDGYDADEGSDGRANYNIWRSLEDTLITLLENEAEHFGGEPNEAFWWPTNTKRWVGRLGRFAIDRKAKMNRLCTCDSVIYNLIHGIQ